LITALTLASSLDEKFSTSLLNSSNSYFFEQAGKLVDKKCLTNLLCNIIVVQQLLLFNLFVVQEVPIYAAL
jgi:hypothetical protein